MYEVDDAVAKIDGYIISVRGAGPFVGSKRLVRIEEAGRTAAVAALIDLTPEEEAQIEADKKKPPRPPSASRGAKRKPKAKPKAKAAPAKPAVSDAPSPEASDAEVKASTGPAGETEADELESKPRRRGRRGGRRRSPRQGAETTDA